MSLVATALVLITTALSSHEDNNGVAESLAVTSLSLAFDVLLAPYQPQVITAGGGETAEWMSPLKLFDYMATGKPILCSDLPVLREIIQNNRNGLMLPDNDSGAWAKALERLSIDPAERNRLGSTAREDFLARFTWDARARRVLNGLV